MKPVTIVHHHGRSEGLCHKGHEAIALAEQAVREGRIDEATRLIEFAYRMFDAASRPVFVKSCPGPGG